MRKATRRLIAFGLFFTGAGTIVFGGPLSSGAIWLSLPASWAPVTAHAAGEPLPWTHPQHQGGIDLATGLYVRTDQDLIVAGGDVPLVLQRTYRNEDQQSRAFGVGSTHPGEWYLRGDGERFQWAELITEAGARIKFDRTSPGTSYLNAMFEHTSSSGPYYGSKLGWSGFNWVLRRQDGSVGIFRACSDTGPDLCTVRELRDPRGRAVHFIRNGTFTRLLAMRSGNQSIDFQYDDHDRIVRATGGPGHDARYTYDEGGRLIRVLETQVANPAKPKIVERRYTYDARGAMLTIDEPGHHIENTYDEAGRCVRQVIRHADGETSEFRVSYRVEGKRIVQTATAWDEGPVTIYTWDANREAQTEQRDALGQWPVTIDYNRSPLSSRSRGVTVHCLDAIGRELRHAEGADDSDAAVDALVQATCH